MLTKRVVLSLKQNNILDLNSILFRKSKYLTNEVGPLLVKHIIGVRYEKWYSTDSELSVDDCAIEKKPHLKKSIIKGDLIENASPPTASEPSLIDLRRPTNFMKKTTLYQDISTKITTLNIISNLRRITNLKQKENADKQAITAKKLKIKADKAAITADKVAIKAKKLQIKADIAAKKLKIKVDKPTKMLKIKTVMMLKMNADKAAKKLKIRADKAAIIAKKLEIKANKPTITAKKLEIKADIAAITADIAAITAKKLKIKADKLATKKLKINADKPATKKLKINADKPAKRAKKLKIKADKPTKMLKIKTVMMLKMNADKAAKKLKIRADKAAIIAKKLEIKANKPAITAKKLEIKADIAAITADIAAITAKKLKIKADKLATKKLKINADKPATKKLKINADKPAKRAKKLKIKSYLQKKENAAKYIKLKNNRMNRNILGFLSVCGNSKDNFIKEKAFHVFMNVETPLEVETINEAVMCVNSLEQLKSVIDIFKKKGKKPNIKTFSYIFSILGEFHPTAIDLNEIQNVLQWMEDENISIKDLFTNGSFPNDSFTNCLEAVIKVKPHSIHEYLNFNSDLKLLQTKHQYQPNVLVQHLNKSLFSKNFISPYKNVITQEQLNRSMNEQVELENQGFCIIPSVCSSKDNVKYEKHFMNFVEEWRQKLTIVIDKQKSFYKKKFLMPSNNIMTIYPYLDSVSTKSIVNLLILEITSLISSSNPMTSIRYLEKMLGKGLYHRYIISCKMDHHRLDIFKQSYSKYLEWYAEGCQQDSSSIPRIQWEKLIADSGTNILRDCPPEWSTGIQWYLGHLLYSTLFSAVTLNDIDDKDQDCKFPAFTKVHISDSNHTYDVIQVSTLLDKIYREFQTSKLVFPISDIPMLVPSLPWISSDVGGFLLNKSVIVRTFDTPNPNDLSSQKIDESYMFPSMDALNQLGSIPWIMNKKMLDLVIEIFKNGGWPELDLYGQFTEKCPPPVEASMSSMQKKTLSIEHKEYKKKEAESYSIWCSSLYKLSLSNHFRDRVFWMPNNMDFRGRVYPIAPHLTHLAGDVFRATMLFAQGKPLGVDGLRWLKLHTINLTGFKKKCSVEERLEYAEQIMDEIFDSADYPVNGRKWWTKSDAPWQTLASCMELKAAMSSEDPEKFISHLPIHQDGSCNGLQHYAALGRDYEGGKSVNLMPSEVPQDIYSDVMKAVEKRRQVEAAMGIPMALALEGYVNRKVIKQTIMTTVYGVTRYGAKFQIKKQLNYLEFPEATSMQASSYLAGLVFDCLGDLFTPTKKIQDWLVLCAKQITKKYACNVEWQTPLDFPVYQPYLEKIKFHKFTGNNILQIDANDSTRRPDSMKHVNGFPPNFIHSLDASHMMLTSIHSQQARINFASIHDCYWTHACTVNIMNKICRDQFVKLYSQPILDNLSKYFREKYKHIQEEEEISNEDDAFLKIPESGTLDLKLVHDSTFFFS